MLKWTYERTEDGLKIRIGDKLTIMAKPGDREFFTQTADLTFSSSDPALLAKLAECLSDGNLFGRLHDEQGCFAGVHIISMENAKAVRIAMSQVLPVDDTVEFLAQLRLATGLGREFGLPDPDRNEEKFMDLATTLAFATGRNLVEEHISTEEAKAIAARVDEIKAEATKQYPQRKSGKELE
jgi:hypothetical protein